MSSHAKHRRKVNKYIKEKIGAAQDPRRHESHDEEVAAVEGAVKTGGVDRVAALRAQFLSLQRLNEGLAAVVAGEPDGWARVLAAVGWRCAGYLADRGLATVTDQSVAGLSALALGQWELAWALAENLLATDADDKLDGGYHPIDYPTCNLLVQLMLKLEDREAELQGSWTGRERLRGYRAAFEALDEPDVFESALVEACDEHMRLTAFKRGYYLDFYADPWPVDIVALMRVLEHLVGTKVALPDHPLTQSPIAAIPSVIEQPELGAVLEQDELFDAFVRGAHQAGLFVAFPGRRASSQLWPPPPQPYASLATEPYTPQPQKVQP